MSPLDHRLTAASRPLAERGLLTPALCFLASHRPLAFLTGQVLYLVEPLATLMGRPGLNTWAELISDPQGLDQLERDWSTLQSPDPPMRGHHDHGQ
jgi:hypothetical protein